MHRIGDTVYACVSLLAVTLSSTCKYVMAKLTEYKGAKREIFVTVPSCWLVLVTVLCGSLDLTIPRFQFPLASDSSRRTEV